MVTAVTTSDARQHLDQCLVENSALRGENGALRQAVQAHVEAVGSLFARLLDVEYERPWLTDALRRSEQQCSELEAQVVELGHELDALRGAEQRCAGLEARVAALSDEVGRVYATKTFRVLSPARRVWGAIRRVLGSSRSRQSGA